MGCTFTVEQNGNVRKIDKTTTAEDQKAGNQPNTVQVQPMMAQQPYVDPQMAQQQMAQQQMAQYQMAQQQMEQQWMIQQQQYVYYVDPAYVALQQYQAQMEQEYQQMMAQQQIYNAYQMERYQKEMEEMNRQLAQADELEKKRKEEEWEQEKKKRIEEEQKNKNEQETPQKEDKEQTEGCPYQQSQFSRTVFEMETYIEKSMQNNYHFAWLENPSCDGINFHYSTAVKREHWNLTAEKDDRGRIIKLHIVDNDKCPYYKSLSEQGKAYHEVKYDEDGRGENLWYLITIGEWFKARPRFTWKMPNYDVYSFKSGEKCPNLNGVQEYDNPMKYPDDIYQKGPGGQKDQWLYDAVIDFDPKGPGRKIAYEELKALNWELPEDWWGQRARDLKNQTQEQQSQAYDQVMAETGQNERQKKYQEIKKSLKK